MSPSYFDRSSFPHGAEPEPIVLPSVCPTCRSNSISTTEKTPDANSYWRCSACGEVWNVGRRKTVRRDTTSWR